MSLGLLARGRGVTMNSRFYERERERGGGVGEGEVAI